MKRSMVGFLVLLTFVVACRGDATPTPDLVATQISVEEAAHATMTAKAPAATEAPAPTQTPTVTTTDTYTPPPTETSAPTHSPSPTNTRTRTPASTWTPSPEPTPTPKPKPTRKPTVKPTARPKPKAEQPSLDKYKVYYSNFQGTTRAEESGPLNYSVSSMRGDGQEATMLFPEAQQPALSVDGTKLTYVHLNAGIHVHDLTTGQALHAITNDRAVAPTLSPDNHRLAYSEYELTWWYGWHKTNAKLMIANADGSDRAAALFGLRPAWSPVNNLIVYEACEGATCGLYILNVDNASTRILVGESAGKASWSPDGQRITYSTAEDGDAETWVINLDGTGAKKLTDNRNTDAMASWSPDGQYIYFLSDREGGWGIWVMRSDGTGQRKVQSIGMPRHWEWAKLSVGWNR